MYGPHDYRKLPTLREILEKRRKQADDLVKQGKSVEAENVMRATFGIPPRKTK